MLGAKPRRKDLRMVVGRAEAWEVGALGVGEWGGVVGEGRARWAVCARSCLRTSCEWGGVSRVGVGVEAAGGEGKGRDNYHHRLHRAVRDKVPLRPRLAIRLLRRVRLHRRQQRQVVALAPEQRPPRARRALLRFLGRQRQEDVLHAEARDDVDRLGEAVHRRVRGREQHAAQRRRQRQPRDLQPHRVDAPRVRQRAELEELHEGFLERLARGAVQEREGRDVVHAAGLQRQDGLAEVAAEDLGRGRGREGAVVALGVQAVAFAGGFAAGATLALDGGGLGDGLHEQGVEAEAGAELLDLGLAAVDDEAHAGDGDGRFGDVGGQDHFAGLGRGGVEDELLGGGGQGGEEGEDKELGHRGREGERVFAHEALKRFDGFLACEEDEDVAWEGLFVVDLEDVAQGGVDEVRDRVEAVDGLNGVLPAGDVADGNVG